jgi:hypothetical protein
LVAAVVAHRAERRVARRVEHLRAQRPEAAHLVVAAAAAAASTPQPFLRAGTLTVTATSLKPSLTRAHKAVAADLVDPAAVLADLRSKS